MPGIILEPDLAEVYPIAFPLFFVFDDYAVEYEILDNKLLVHSVFKRIDIDDEDIDIPVVVTVRAIKSLYDNGVLEEPDDFSIFRYTYDEWMGDSFATAYIRDSTGRNTYFVLVTSDDVYLYRKINNIGGELRVELIKRLEEWFKENEGLLDEYAREVVAKVFGWNREPAVSGGGDVGGGLTAKNFWFTPLFLP